MAPLAQNASSMAGGDPNSILNECREIDRGVDGIDRSLQQLGLLQQRILDDADSSASSASRRQLDALSADTMTQYRALTERIRLIKSNPDSRTPKNNPQVSRVDRRLKAAIHQYQQVESQFRKRIQGQMERQYRIVRPDASDAEVRAAVEDTSGGQVFSQALMQSDRQGRARSALTAVQDRHAMLVKIEQQMVELSQLFQDMDTLVVQQEAAVMQIEQKGEEVVDNLDKGNEEIGVAVNTARKTRKKKWICLGICGESSRRRAALARRPSSGATADLTPAAGRSAHRHHRRRHRARLPLRHPRHLWRRQQQQQQQRGRKDQHQTCPRRRRGRPPHCRHGRASPARRRRGREGNAHPAPGLSPSPAARLGPARQPRRRAESGEGRRAHRDITSRGGRNTHACIPYTTAASWFFFTPF